jgi:transcription elongation GreA/GreB family factor
MTQRPKDPIYLTPAGRQRLEEQAARYAAEVAAWRASEGDEPGAEDRGDAAERLIEADDVIPARDLLAETQAVLDRAVPMPAGAADGIVRLGATVTIRDADGTRSRYLVVDPAEFHDGENQVAADSPVGQALVGRARGSQITIDIPAGRQMLTIEAVEPYKERAP